MRDGAAKGSGATVEREELGGIALSQRPPAGYSERFLASAKSGSRSAVVNDTSYFLARIGWLRSKSHNSGAEKHML